jgi:CrcB protein
MGSLAIGLVWAALQRLDTSPVWSAFLITGVLGGFTTFSSFSMETLLLLEEGAWRTALWYVTLSISTCVLGAWLGVWIIRVAL